MNHLCYLCRRHTVPNLTPDGHTIMKMFKFGSDRIRRVAEIQIFEKTYLIVIKDETGLKYKMNDSTLVLIWSYAQKLVASH